MLARLRSARASFEAAIGLVATWHLETTPSDARADQVRVDLALEADGDLRAACLTLGVEPPVDELPGALAIDHTSILTHWRASRWLHHRLDLVDALVASLESKTPGDDGPYR